MREEDLLRIRLLKDEVSFDGCNDWPQCLGKGEYYGTILYDDCITGVWGYMGHVRSMGARGSLVYLHGCLGKTV